MIRIKKINEVYIKILCDPGLLHEISDNFTFYVPGYKHMPLYKNKVWDGKIKLVNTMTASTYAGLAHEIEKFAQERNYECTIEDFIPDEFSLIEAIEFIKSLNLPFTPREYQVKAFIHAIRHRRCVLLSPTASGKSLIIYMIVMYYNLKTLIIVPTTSLIKQLTKNFTEYGYTDSVHNIYSGQEKDNIEATVTISTWQSIYKMPKEWFSQFEVVIGDECHHFKAKSLTDIMTKLTSCQYRFGFTGTLDDTQTHQMMLQGLFGQVNTVQTTSELIKQDAVSDLMIKCILLNYSDDIKKEVITYDYHGEIDWLVTNPNRNNFIKNLTLSLKDNTLLLFQFVEKQGKELYDIIRKATDRQVFYVAGSVDAAEREEIRKKVQNSKDSIIVASFGTFSTGIDIPSLSNVVFCSPSKSKIRILQSIGRGIRKHEDKAMATIYDIADDLSWKKKQNTTLRHFIERVELYNSQNFKYKIYKTRLK